MLTLSQARRLLEGGNLPGGLKVDEIPGVSELRSMCHNARTIAGLCDLIRVQGDPEREGQIIGLEDELRVGPGGFILPPE